MPKLFYLKKNQFCISTHFSSIWLIDKILSGATILRQSGLGVMAMKGYSTLPKAPAIVEPHHEIL